MSDSPIRTLNVLLFGYARELAGTHETTLDVDPSATVGDAVGALLARYPALAPLDRVLLTAVDETYTPRSSSIGDGRTLAVFPPVSGGEAEADVFELTREPISIEALRARLLRGEDGAVCVFDGVARNNTKGRPTRYLEYEGYEEMAISTMRQVADEARERWPAVDRIGVVHRLGHVDIGESSIVIVVTSAHRGVTFEACRYLIDRIKQIVPIWKKEFFEDGAVWVQGEAWPE